MTGFFSNINLVLKEKADQYIAKIDLPGVTENDLEISLEKNILSVKAEKKHEIDREEGETREA